MGVQVSRINTQILILTKLLALPCLGTVDPANLRAQARWRMNPDPLGGGSYGYPNWSREEQLEKWNAGEKTVASEASLYQWLDRLIPHRCTGNRTPTQIVSTDLINLVVLLFAHPDTTIDEMAAHIYNEGREFYSSQQISKRLKGLDITTKIASVEAYQAQAEAVQHHVFCFWNRAPPLGISQVPWRMLIDVDEFGVTIEKCNRKKGWVLKLFWVRKDGHYGHGQKLTILFAIEPGDSALPANVYGSGLLLCPRDCCEINHLLRCLLSGTGLPFLPLCPITATVTSSHSSCFLLKFGLRCHISN